jgi:hypothetical protein
MIFPNKFIRYEESVIFKMISVLSVCEIEKELTIQQLYKITETEFSGIDEFLYSLDILYILNSIKVDFTTHTISYVENN